jgi:general secretion pathway protein D
MFNETRSNSNSLYSAQLRSVAGQPATLHVGEKYPVITGGYFGASTATQAGQTYAPPPSFTFVDLGLEMKVTPFINGVDVTTLGVETSFQVINGQAVNGIPIIGNRSLKSQVTLRNGEWAVIGTLVNRTRSKGSTGFWGLAQLPFLGALFKQTTTDDEENNVLIGVRTRLLSLPAQEMAIRSLRVGSDQRPYNPL